MNIVTTIRVQVVHVQGTSKNHEEGDLRSPASIGKMKRLLVLALLVIVICSFTAPPLSFGQPMHGRSPHGSYCSGRGWGWYGEKKAVKTADKAKKVLEEYFKSEDVTIGDINERRFFFMAEIKDKENKVIDKVIVDKRTGRIRSIY